MKSIDQTLRWETEHENNLKRSMALKKQKLRQDLCTQISERLDHELSLKEENLHLERKDLETKHFQVLKEDLEQQQEKVCAYLCFVIDIFVYKWFIILLFPFGNTVKISWLVSKVFIGCHKYQNWTTERDKRIGRTMHEYRFFTKTHKIKTSLRKDCTLTVITVLLWLRSAIHSISLFCRYHLQRIYFFRHIISIISDGLFYGDWSIVIWYIFIKIRQTINGYLEYFFAIVFYPSCLNRRIWVPSKQQ